MFTGIIEEMGVIASARPSGLSIAVSPALASKLSIGGSVAVEGVCLTATGIAEGRIEVDVMPETLRRTTLGGVTADSPVNLELPATPTSFLAGHVVQGHVDGVGTVADVVEEGNSHVVRIQAPSELAVYIVEKGSIAVNGVSLTVAGIEGDTFTVAIIPHTWEATTFSKLAEGSRVNIETDVLAKYIEKRILSTYARRP